MLRDNIDHIDIVSLSTLHIYRETFHSRSDALNSYFHRYVSQDEKKNLTKCFTLIDRQQAKIIGFYTLSASVVSVTNIPKDKLKREIRYPDIPAVLIGRLAIDEQFEGQGYGKFLIADAIARVKSSNLGVAVLVVDAKDDAAVSFYQRLGFISFNDFQGNERKLFYPLTNLISKM